MEVANYPKYIADYMAEHFGVINPIEETPNFPFPGKITHDIGRTKTGSYFFGAYVELDGIADYEGEVATFKEESNMLKALAVLASQPDNEFDLTPQIVEDLLQGYKDL